ncbi:MAG TPA: hypothetical protein VFB72_06070 [Verrucomicrobiae bacterium]|nr:hypothetical protein [Verrucomicrobiae bacterium]
MKKSIFSAIAAVVLLTLVQPLFAGDLEKMAGKWTCVRTNEGGIVCTQRLEISKDQFTFRVTDPDKNTMLYAKGDVKVSKCGDFNCATFENMQAGRSEGDLNDVDDDRHCVYMLDGDTLTIGLNFDKDREKGPRIEVYTRDQK